MAARSNTAARSRGSVPARAPRSRCCPHKTRRETGSRSFSACRSASSSMRRSSPRIRCRSGCRCRSMSIRTIPAISGDLGVSPNQGTWVITSFGVANAISLPLTGWLTRRYGQVRLFLASVVLFVIASFLCALAPSIELLILFRVIQGAVAGPMIPLSQSLLLSSYPKEKAGSALALWAITTLVAPVVGPLLGGWITDNIAWPWIFYINIPVGLGAAAVTWLIYQKRETPTLKLPIDGVGLALLVLWVGALQITLDKGKDLDWFESGRIVVLVIVAVVAFTMFMIWELTEEHPIVDLKL